MTKILWLKFFNKIFWLKFCDYNLVSILLWQIFVWLNNCDGDSDGSNSDCSNSDGSDSDSSNSDCSNSD